MAGKGKKKRTEADEAESSLQPGLEQPLEEEKVENNIDRKETHKRYRKKVKYVSQKCKTFCLLPENRNKFKTYVEELRKRLENDGTNEPFCMDYINCLCELEKEIENLAAKSTPSKPPMRGREEELAETLKGKMPATADDCTSTHLATGGSQPSGFVDAYVAKGHGPDQTPSQLDVPSWTTLVRPGMGSKVDPASVGFDCKTRPPHESCDTEVVISKMQEMQDNIIPKIQWAVVEAFEWMGFCQPTNASIASHAGPHHNPLGKQGGTNAAAGSFGGPTTQSSLHNEELELKVYKAFCEVNGISDMFKVFSEGYMRKTNEESLDLEEDAHSDEEIKIILKDFPKNPWPTLEENLESETTQTGGLVGVTAVNSSSFGAIGKPFEREELKKKREKEKELDEACRAKRPATASSTTPSCPPIGGFVAEASVSNCQSTAVLATQIQTREAAHVMEASGKMKGKLVPEELGDVWASNT